MSAEVVDKEITIHRIEYYDEDGDLCMYYELQDEDGIQIDRSDTLEGLF